MKNFGSSDCLNVGFVGISLHHYCTNVTDIQDRKLSNLLHRRSSRDKIPISPLWLIHGDLFFWDSLDLDVLPCSFILLQSAEDISAAGGLSLYLLKYVYAYL